MPQGTPRPAPLSLKDFRRIAAHHDTLVIYEETRDGIEVFAQCAQRLYQLYTFRNQPRRFKSGETAFRFARNLDGVDIINWYNVPFTSLDLDALRSERGGLGNPNKGAKWYFCSRSASLPFMMRDHDETSTPEP